MNKQIETVKKFGVIAETYEKVLKASELASKILAYIDKTYDEDFFITHWVEYNFIDTKKDAELAKQIQKGDIPRKEAKLVYRRLLNDCQLSLTFPIMKTNASIVTSLFMLIDDYKYIINTLEGVFTDSCIFTVSTMKYMNQINNRTIKRMRYNNKRVGKIN